MEQPQVKQLLSEIQFRRFGAPIHMLSCEVASAFHVVQKGASGLACCMNIPWCASHVFERLICLQSGYTGLEHKHCDARVLISSISTQD